MDKVLLKQYIKHLQIPEINKRKKAEKKQVYLTEQKSKFSKRQLDLASINIDTYIEKSVILTSYFLMLQDTESNRGNLKVHQFYTTQKKHCS